MTERSTRLLFVEDVEAAVAFEVGSAHRGTELQLRNREGAIRAVIVYSEATVLDEVAAILSSVVDMTGRRPADAR